MTGARVQPPPPRPFTPLSFLADDLRRELRALRRPGPPGALGIDFPRMRALNGGGQLGMVLELHERFGPVFEMRAFQHRLTWLVGPEATAFALLEQPDAFHWREGHLGQLVPLLGDGILTTDGAYHDRARRLMMPAFHQRRMAAAVEVMRDEAASRSAGWADGEVVDVYAWARETALRIAMRVLLGLDPDAHEDAHAAADAFERALAFWGTGMGGRLARGPKTPWARMVVARRELDAIVHRVIVQRRRAGAHEGTDVLGALLRASAEHEDGFSDREIRDQLVTLLFAGHDTTTSTVAFLLHELAHEPALQTAVREDDDLLEPALDETLRRYPPVFVGARRAMRDVEVCGVPVRGGSMVLISYWATHHVSRVFPDPFAFRPDRWTREMRAALPRGGYTPFGGGSRICIGKRFGMSVTRTVSRVLLDGFAFSPVTGRAIDLKLEPTLSPRRGMPLRVLRRPRAAPRAAS